MAQVVSNAARAEADAKKQPTHLKELHQDDHHTDHQDHHDHEHDPHL